MSLRREDIIIIVGEQKDTLLYNFCVNNVFTFDGKKKRRKEEKKKRRKEEKKKRRKEEKKKRRKEEKKKRRMKEFSRLSASLRMWCQKKNKEEIC
jgi:hypothetical protein